jgi:hypothetical protein
MQAPCPSTKFHKKEKENYSLEKSEITHKVQVLSCQLIAHLNCISESLEGGN